MPKQPRAVVRDPRRNGAPMCTGHWADGTPCQRIAVGSTTKCGRHGGKSLSGPAAGSYKTGRYSRSLPANLAVRYEEARANPRLLSLSDDIALAEARLAELLAQVETGAGEARWHAMCEAIDAFSVAVATRDGDAMDTHLKTIQDLRHQAGDAAATWREIQEVWGSRAKLIQTEMKTLQGMQQMITVQQHMLMVGAQTDAVVRAVQKHADVQTGRKILMDVQAAFEKLANLEERR